MNATEGTLLAFFVAVVLFLLMGKSYLDSLKRSQRVVNDPKGRSSPHSVNRMLQSYEDTSRHRCESGWTFSMPILMSWYHQKCVRPDE